MTYDIEQGLSTLYIAPIATQGVIWFGKGSTIEEAEDRLVGLVGRDTHSSQRLILSELDMISTSFDIRLLCLLILSVGFSQIVKRRSMCFGRARPWKESQVA